MDERDPLTERIIGCAIEVHRQLGFYEGVRVGDYKPDVIVEDQVVLEIKSVLKFEPVFLAQMLTYLRITGLKRGLILNFNKPLLKAGIKRVVL
jgi:GxxExxY protein